MYFSTVPPCDVMRVAISPNAFPSSRFIRSAPMRVTSSVEPTTSTNMAVTRRRSSRAVVMARESRLAPVNVAIAFGAGILSFLSPCVLPLVPAFLVDMAGEAALADAQRARTRAHGLAFVLGFSTVFTLLWIAVALVGSVAGEMVSWLQKIGGLLLVVLGMQMLGLIRIPFLARELDLRLEGRTTGLPRSFLIGLAFGVGFTPCVGPYLGAILTLLLGEDLGSGAVLLVAYTLGLGVPFLLLAGGLGGAQRVARWLAAHIRVVNLAGGTLVIAMGLVLVSGQFARLPQLFNFLPLVG